MDDATQENDDAPRVEVLGPFDVCVDCIMFIANGDLPPDSTPERDAEIIAGCDRELPAQWVAGGAECSEHGRDHAACDAAGCTPDDSGFSWSSCDCCGSTLGGDRHAASLIRHNEREG